jgi:hypothetical protein
MDYQNGRIYRLVCNKTGKQYIGSTTQSLTKRKSIHKAGYNAWKANKRHYMTSYDIIDGQDYDIILVEDYPCQSKEQLHSRERHWIENTECVNKRIPTRTQKESNEDNKEQRREAKKKYIEINKERIAEQRKQFREANRARLAEIGRKYYERNKEQIQERRKRHVAI